MQVNSSLTQSATVNVATTAAVTTAAVPHISLPERIASDLHIDFGWLGMAIVAQSEESSSPRVANGHTDTRILGGMWGKWRRLVVPHDARNATRDVFGDDHSDLWQPEPQHDLDGGRELNTKTELRGRRRKRTEAAAESSALNSVLGVSCILVFSTILLNYAEMTAGSEEPRS